MEHFKFSGSTLLGIIVFPADFAIPVAPLNCLEEFKRDPRKYQMGFCLGSAALSLILSGKRDSFTGQSFHKRFTGVCHRCRRFHGGGQPA